MSGRPTSRSGSEFNLSRRHFLGAATAAAAGMAFGGGLLGGCRPEEPDHESSAGSGNDNVLRISNWPLYIDAATVSDFERATGISVQYTEDINDNNEFFAKIDEPLKRGQSIDRDIIILTDWMAGRLIQLGYVQPIDDANFPNKKNLLDRLRQVGFDPGRRYSVPWLSVMTGLGYNPRKTGRELTSANDIFDPKFAGQVTMLTEMRDSLGVVMVGMGIDPEQCTIDDARAACAKIKRYRESGHIRAFTGNDYTEDLAAGNIAVAVAWSGDIQGLSADNPDLRWVAPSEGAMIFSDNMLIPRTSRHADLASKWMNYVYDPAHSARIVAAVAYPSAVKGAGEELAKLSPELARSPLANPTPEQVAKLRGFKWLDEHEDREFNRLFLDAMGG